MAIHAFDSAQFAQFVRFANNPTLRDKENSIARLDSTTALGNHTIKVAAKNDDSVHACTRSAAAKRANDAVRDLFRKAVGEIFGGESRIPESVKKAMVLSDYGKGRPLTARRILVVRAAIDAVRNSVDVAGGNKKITTAIRNIQLDKLPAEINDALEDVRAAMAARGGAGMPGDKTALLKLLSPIRVFNALEAHAKETGRPLTRADVRDVLLGMIEDDQVVEVAKLSAFMSAMGAESFNVSVNRATANAMRAAVPGLKAGLKACKSEEDFQAVFEKHGPTVQAHLVIMGEALRCKKQAAEMLVEEFVKATGRDADFFRENVPLQEFTSDAADKIQDKISEGAIKAKSPREVEAAFRDAARAYVQARLDVVKQVDSLKGVSDAVRESLKFGVFVAKDVTGHRIAEYAPLAAKLDLAPLRAAVLRKPFSAEVVAPVLRQTMLALSKIGVEFCGRDKWIEMGVDGQQPYASIVLKCALSGDPELAKALADHADELHAKTIELVPPDEPGTVFMLTAATPAIHELAAQL